MKFTTPAAILLGCALIAATIHFGLQDRASTGFATVAAEPPLPVVSSAPPASASPAVASADDAEARAAADLEAVLERRRADLVRECWTPAASRVASPAVSRFTINVTFDARGIQRARGLSEVRGTTRTEVTRCLEDALGTLEIEAPGRVTRVEIPFALPG